MIDPPDSGRSPAMQLSAGRLAAAGRAEQRNELPPLDRHRELGEGVEHCTALSGEAARHGIELELAEIVLRH
jgi:hypothetical protein